MRHDLSRSTTIQIDRGAGDRIQHTWQRPGLAQDGAAQRVEIARPYDHHASYDSKVIALATTLFTLRIISTTSVVPFTTIYDDNLRRSLCA